MKAILQFLGMTSDPAATDSDTIRRIADELDRLEPDKARYIAAFAFVLSRIARADQNISAEETATMERLVREKGGLSEGQAALAVQMAKSQHLLFGGTDDFLVTRELARVASYDEKLGLIECLFAVAAADKSITNDEADEIAKTGKELKVDPADLSRLRASYREHLAARKGMTD